MTCEYIANIIYVQCVYVESENKSYLTLWLNRLIHIINIHGMGLLVVNITMLPNFVGSHGINVI